MGMQVHIFNEMQFIFRQTMDMKPRMARIARIGNGLGKPQLHPCHPEIRGKTAATLAMPPFFPAVSLMVCKAVGGMILTKPAIPLMLPENFQ
jgi:hypothetical protein